MAGSAQPETEDQRAARLLRIAMDVAVRIREEAPDAVAREFGGLDYQELRDLALLASACIDVQRPYSDVVWWAEVDRPPVKHRVKPGGQLNLRPCGTRAAYRRHLAHGEKPDLACELAYRREESERKKRPSGALPGVHRLPTAEPVRINGSRPRLAA